MISGLDSPRRSGVRRRPGSGSGGSNACARPRRCATPDWRNGHRRGGDGAAGSCPTMPGWVAPRRVGGGGLGLDRSQAGHSQRPDGLDGAVRSFGHHGGDASQHCSGGGLGVDGVGLARLAARSSLRSWHLQHGDLFPPQVAGQAGAVGAGAFHPDSAHPAEATHPPHQVSVGLVAGGELGGPEQPAVAVDHRCAVGGGMVSTPPMISSYINAVLSTRWCRGRSADRPVMRHLSSSSYQVTLVTEPTGSQWTVRCRGGRQVLPKDTRRVRKLAGETIPADTDTSSSLETSDPGASPSGRGGSDAALSGSPNAGPVW
jgi:hypothetical protein